MPRATDHGPPYSEGRFPQRLLVVRLGAVGDLVRTLPAVALLRQAWPATRIGWIVEKHLASFLDGHPLIDRLLTIDRKAFVQRIRRADPRALGVVRDVRSALRDFAPELALDFQGSFKSGLTSYLSGARWKLSFEGAHVREGSHLFANRRVPLAPEDRHRVRRALALARAAGAGSDTPPADLALTERERARGAELWQARGGGRPVVALAPFSSRLQAWKRYPVERWTAIARALAAQGFVVILIAGPGEEEEGRALARAAGAGVQLAGDTSLRELAALLERCALLIGGDTGPMHMAWAVGTPVVALFGPTDPVLNAPWGEGHAWLAPSERTRRDAPDKFPGITPERVLAEALRLLDGRGARPMPS